MDFPVDAVRVGVLHDFPQRDDSFEQAVRLGLDGVLGGRYDRPVELVTRQVRGLPFGSEHAVIDGFAALADDGVIVIIGPSISDNALIARDCAAEHRVAAINWSGGERTRGPWMLHYQVGSLEEEPPLLAARLAERGLRRAAVVHDSSPVGRGYLDAFDAARATYGLDLTGAASISPVSEDRVLPALERLRAGNPDALVYFGLGASSHAVATTLLEMGWQVPVVANSALMFGYLRRDWRDAWRGWEYVDGVADDNPMRARLTEQAPSLAAAPTGCAGFDMGRLVGEALARCEHLTRAGVADGLRRIKRLPATTGRAGTYMGFGNHDHAALKGEYLVLREWKDGETVQIARP
jgi:branched-chain amino acid transport system substrate-binding protein